MTSPAPAVLIIDLEVNPKTDAVFKLGAYRPDLELGYERAVRNVKGFREALLEMEYLANGAHWLMGHNILAHDLRYLKEAAPDLPWLSLPVLDTLRLSPLAFPQNPYHRLIKNHKIISSSLNSPEADCRACWQLFQDQCAAFGNLKTRHPETYGVYSGLFGALPYQVADSIVIPGTQTQHNAYALIPHIWNMVQDEVETGRLKVCKTRFTRLMREDIHRPELYIPLAYALSWLSVSGGNSVLAPWVRHQFPDTARLIAELRDHDCGDAGCRYCCDTLNPVSQLKRYFGFASFRGVDGVTGGQQAIVKAGMNGEHVLAVLPTGGGKSLCFQLPALNRYYRNGGLTVVVSPLQSLMKDQVDNLKAKGRTDVDTLNGMLSVTERADVLDRVALGDVGILFVAPEQFRNTSFIKAIEHRQINGWVFDEAHCLSKWGHDFRPDYLYAAKFIAKRNRNGAAAAPVSCFTATAKPDVLQEITEHFREELGIEFKQFIGGNERSNLFYEVLEVSDDLKNRYIDELLHRELDHQDGGAVVFVARQKSAEKYAEFLKRQGWDCEYFHAGLQANAKAEIQDDFIHDRLRVIVATNAFGMGVDKPNVRLVVHAEITGSLENYLQEAGRAGRDQKEAKCVLLFDRSDVDTQFRLSRFSQLEQRDLQSVWRKLKLLNRTVSGKAEDDAIVVTGGEILRDTEGYMSFDSDDRQADTKVKAALAWLERADLLERSENQTRIFPSRSGRLNLDQAWGIIAKANLGQRKTDLYRTIAEIVFNADDDAPLSTDVLAQATACSFAELRGHLKKLEELGVLVNDTKMTVNLRTDHSKPSEKRLELIIGHEEKLWQILNEKIPDADRGVWQNLSLTAVCREMHDMGCETVPADIKLLMQSLAYDKAAAETRSSGSFDIIDKGNDMLLLRFKDKQSTWAQLRENAALRRHICMSLLPLLISKTGGIRSKDAVVETSFGELEQHIGDDLALAAQIPENRREILLKQALLFMHKLGVIKLNHGMTILRHAMTIRLDHNALEQKRQYLKADYRPLEIFYGEKRFQIHVMQEYALCALKNLQNGWELVSDYFKTSEKDFKNKWFKGRLKELEESISPQTLHTITDGLNAIQKAVVTGKQENRLVLAGPGSGKTRVIVHRTAYLLKAEHVNPASVIILTFNRLAAQEIKRRLFELVGSLAAAVTVLTYDGMAMRLLGVRFDGKKEYEEGQFKKWCREAAAMLSGGLSADADSDDARDRIMAGFRYILVDEYQDITEEHYELVSALAGRKREDEDEKLTIIAVGDDDQNIYAFNGTSNEYIHRFLQDYGVKQPDFLTFNYRSTQNIITAANRLIQDMGGRLKTLHPIVINPERQHQPNGGIWSERDGERQGRVRVVKLPSQGSRQQKNNIQAQAVAAEIRRLQALADIEYRSIAVLSRNNGELKPMQAWCEQNNIPYFLAKDRKHGIRLRHTREFVRLVEQVVPDKQQEGQKEKTFTGNEFAELIRSQDAGGMWQDYFRQTAQDFLRENTADTGYPAAFLKNWLYEYVGNESESRSDGIFLGTAHSVKGLEFKHVFVLDGGWNSADESEQRLYYVAMTRAIETLTLIQNTPQHLWIGRLPEETECVERSYTVLPELDTEYRTLSLYSDKKENRPAELDIGFIARETRNASDLISRLEAAKKLKVGDALTIRRGGWQNKQYEFCTDGIAVARTAKNAAFPELDAVSDLSAIRVRAAAFGVRYREDEQYTDNIPKKIQKWPLVIPMLIIPK